MKKVLFLCSGNTCRSPLAEYLFNDMAKKQGLDWYASSAGLAAWEGDGISAFSEDILRRDYGIEAHGHRSRPLDQQMLNENDLILTMTEGQRRALLRVCPEFENKIYTLHGYNAKCEAEQGQGEGAKAAPAEVSDPYGGDIHVYASCAQEIEQALRRLLMHLAENPSKK